MIENKINNKKYIGKTLFPIEKRWKEHCMSYDCKTASHKYLYRAMRKYGIENFSIFEIEQINDDSSNENNLNDREKYWIRFYDSYKNGYNCTVGGDGSSDFEYSDEEVINKYYELKTIKDTAKFFNCNPYTISIRLHKNNIKFHACGYLYKDNKNWKTVIVEQFSKEKEYIQSFESIRAAARWIIENNYSKGKESGIASNISRAIKQNNTKTAFGFIWKQKEEIELTTSL